MKDTGLNSGDRVIAVAGLARTSAAVSGVFSAVLSAWLFKAAPGAIILMAIGGGLIGYLIGLVTGRLMFSAGRGRVLVVKHGTKALPHTFKAGISGAIISALIVSVLVSLYLGRPIQAGVPLSLGAGALIGIVLSLMSALL